MHELSMVESVIEIAEAEARRHDGACITKVKLRIGQFTGVVKEALEFAFEVARQGTMAAEAELEIEIVPLKKRCPLCHSIFDSTGDWDFVCERCDAPVEIISGREMQVEYIEIG